MYTESIRFKYSPFEDKRKNLVDGKIRFGYGVLPRWYFSQIVHKGFVTFDVERQQMLDEYDSTIDIGCSQSFGKFQELCRSGRLYFQCNVPETGTQLGGKLEVTQKNPTNRLVASAQLNWRQF